MGPLRRAQGSEALGAMGAERLAGVSRGRAVLQATPTLVGTPQGTTGRRPADLLSLWP